MAWKFRHEVRRSVVRTAWTSAILEGIEDGRWEPTDEVQGPGERSARPMRTIRKLLADAVADASRRRPGATTTKPGST